MGIKEDEAKLAEWVKTGNDAADAKVDSFLDKVKASKWTAPILGAVAGAIVVIMLAVIF
jgi:hypothetical protein